MCRNISLLFHFASTSCKQLDFHHHFLGFVSYTKQGIVNDSWRVKSVVVGDMGGGDGLGLKKDIDFEASISSPNCYVFSRLRERNHLKTLWEKRKMLITSSFLFSHKVFYLVNEVLFVSINFIFI